MRPTSVVFSVFHAYFLCTLNTRFSTTTRVFSITWLSDCGFLLCTHLHRSIPGVRNPLCCPCVMCCFSCGWITWILVNFAFLVRSCLCMRNKSALQVKLIVFVFQYMYVPDGNCADRTHNSSERRFPNPDVKIIRYTVCCTFLAELYVFSRVHTGP